MQTEMRVVDDLSYLGAVNREISSVNACIILLYSVAHILKNVVCLF